MPWPFRRRPQPHDEPIDATGPATQYPTRSGGLDASTTDQGQDPEQEREVNRLIDPWTGDR
ncbi:hypothetical protein [Micromonospora sp. WMMD737]|uniref:hypothetical protein n=1 Tax=Micromonospora sp. WMMD737 TaxID=3404113 RepID=UPI003B95A2BB